MQNGKDSLSCVILPIKNGPAKATLPNPKSARHCQTLPGRQPPGLRKAGQHRAHTFGVLDRRWKPFFWRWLRLEPGWTTEVTWDGTYQSALFCNQTWLENPKKLEVSGKFLGKSSINAINGGFLPCLMSLQKPHQPRQRRLTHGAAGRCKSKGILGCNGTVGGWEEAFQ